jgi:hypothetical protein
MLSSLVRTHHARARPRQCNIRFPPTMDTELDAHLVEPTTLEALKSTLTRLGVTPRDAE